jgi:hypothetical protein
MSFKNSKKSKASGWRRNCKKTLFHTYIEKKGKHTNLKRNQITPMTYSKKPTKSTRRSIKKVHDQQGGNETRNAQ